MVANVAVVSSKSVSTIVNITFIIAIVFGHISGHSYINMNTFYNGLKKAAKWSEWCKKARSRVNTLYL